MLVLVGACSSPPERADAYANEAGFHKSEVPGEGFAHRTYERGLRAGGVAELHIYIGGDGTPWIDGRYPAEDPTPRQPLTLALMAEDPAPSVFIGRPCYFGQAKGSDRCDKRLWTSGRYAPEVVASMLAVVEHYRRAYGPERLLLVGYSGGGVLAALLAPQLQGSVFLVTIASNLDTQRWTEWHGYLPLKDSLNPLDYRERAADLPQLHLAGLEDESVPIAVTRAYTAGLSPGMSREYPGVDHNCCWQALWRDLLLEQPWRDRPGG